ncbi:MAG: SIMPL domain-containing protein [Arcobacteraceae bacterium]
MKLPLLLSLPLLAFGFELNFTKEFSKSLVPSELTSTIKVIVDKEEEKEVISSLNTYNDFLKKYDEITKSNVSMSITPKYGYKDGLAYFVGYTGVLNYTISSNESSKVKEFFENFYAIKEENNTTSHMPALQWRINEKVYEETLDKLRFDAITWGNSYSAELSKKLNKQCSIKEIQINGNFARPIMYNSEVKMLKSSKMEIPIVEQVDEIVSIQPTFNLVCQ